jgi:hypothetical protein
MRKSIIVSLAMLAMIFSAVQSSAYTKAIEQPESLMVSSSPEARTYVVDAKASGAIGADRQLGRDALTAVQWQMNWLDRESFHQLKLDEVRKLLTKARAARRQRQFEKSERLVSQAARQLDLLSAKWEDFEELGEDLGKMATRLESDLAKNSLYRTGIEFNLAELKKIEADYASARTSGKGEPVLNGIALRYYERTRSLYQQQDDLFNQLTESMLLLKDELAELDEFAPYIKLDEKSPELKPLLKIKEQFDVLAPVMQAREESLAFIAEMKTALLKRGVEPKTEQEVDTAGVAVARKMLDQASVKVNK